MSPIRITSAFGSLAQLTCLLLLLLPVFSFAQSERVIYSFTSEPNGVAPESGLLALQNGALYGTTTSVATVFKLTPPTVKGGAWTETTIYDFSGVNDGVFPVDLGSLVTDASGNLYGTTVYGGQFGFGTVFELTPPISGDNWTETILYNFGIGPDAQYPEAGLLMDRGVLYGTTKAGGASGVGTVFKLSPGLNGSPWQETILYSFTGGNDGSSPMGTPTRGPGGALYGTAAGGVNGNGVVYQLSPPTDGSATWVETVLHSFNNGSVDGATPIGAPLLDSHGAIYGATYSSIGGHGYGLVYKLSPPSWDETILYQFKNRSDGEHPQSGLIFDQAGALYGTTEGSAEQGGDQGSVYKLTPPGSSGGLWTETTLHGFTGGSDGGTPIAGLLLRKGILYGTTYEGGPQPNCNCGVAFEIKP